MIKSTYPGKFIVFDGLDGSGQSTQAELLAEFLGEKAQRIRLGHTGVHTTKEPTSGLIGGLIRGQLSKDWKSNPQCLQLLFAADRSAHLEKEIIPLLERGITIITDRYAYSSFAYGSVAGCDERWLKQINAAALQPDLTFFLRVSPKICVQRIHTNRYNITLFEQEEIFKKVWKKYEAIAKQDKHVVVVDGERPVAKIAKEIQDIALKRLA